MPFDQYIINIIEGAFIIVLLFWMIILQLRLKKMFRGAQAKDLETLIRQNVDAIIALQKQLAKDEAGIRALQQELLSSKRHVGIVRFNAFQEAGGEQSFAIATLDDRKNGIIISSMHSRESTRTYAKPIINGKSSHHLSEEEQEAIKRAIAKSI